MIGAIARRVGRTLKQAGFGGIMFALGSFYGPFVIGVGHGLAGNIWAIGVGSLKRILLL